MIKLLFYFVLIIVAVFAITEYGPLLMQYIFDATIGRVFDELDRVISGF